MIDLIFYVADLGIRCIALIVLIVLCQILVVPWLQDLWAGFWREPGP